MVDDLTRRWDKLQSLLPKSDGGVGHLWSGWPYKCRIHCQYSFSRDTFEFTVYFHGRVYPNGGFSNVRGDFDVDPDQVDDLTRDNLDKMIYSTIGNALAYVTSQMEALCVNT